MMAKQAAPKAAVAAHAASTLVPRISPLRPSASVAAVTRFSTSRAKHGVGWNLGDQKTLEGRQTLYDVRTGQRSIITANKTPGDCGTSILQGPCPFVVQVGSKWVAVEVDEDELLGQYENRNTGQVANQPTSRKLNVQLNTPGLFHRVCSPLSVPSVPVPNSGMTAPGSLTAIGHGFELATAYRTFLERCGTHLHRQVGCDGACTVAHDTTAVVWATNVEVADPHAAG